MTEALCSKCGKPHAPEGYHYPRNIRKEKTYFLCIPWTTLDECRRQSLLNARSLLTDSRLLVKEKRYRAAKILAILALEEVGRAQLAIEHMKEYKDVTYEEYRDLFLDHRSKIEAAQRALNPTEGPWDFRTMLYEDEKFNEQYVDYSWEYKSWNGPRSMDQGLADTRYEAMFRLTGGDKAEEEFDQMREAGEGINKGFVSQLIDEAERGVDAVEHLLTEKDVTMVSVLNLIRGGTLNSPHDEEQILEMVRRTGVNPKEGELRKSIEKYVRWRMLKRTGRIRIRFTATDFGVTGTWKEEPKIEIPPRRFTLPFLEGMAKSLDAKRSELDRLLSAFENVTPRSSSAKLPSLSFQSSIDYYRKAVQEHGDSPEAKRVLTKWLVDMLRRDLFVKYYDIARRFEGIGDRLKAAVYMNEYAVLCGIPFARRRRYPWFVKRLMNSLRERRRKPPFDAIQLWKDSFRECIRILTKADLTREELKKYHMLQSNLGWLNFYSV
jgi:AbiV family abortive infection protein